MRRNSRSRSSLDTSRRTFFQLLLLGMWLLASSNSFHLLTGSVAAQSFPSVGIAPSVTNLALGASVQLTATVTGLSDPSVSWAVESGGGSVDGTGLYTAPTEMPAERRAVVRATANGDPSRFGEAEVWLAPELRTGGLGMPEELAGGVWVETADMNGDGRPDIVRTVGVGFGVLLREGTGWSELPLVPIVGGWLADFVLRDVDGDGDEDVIVAWKGTTNEGLQVYENDGSGRLTALSAVSTSTGYEKLVTADFNGDGHLDVAAARTLVASVVASWRWSRWFFHSVSSDQCQWCRRTGGRGRQRRRPAGPGGGRYVPPPT